jgi:HlyD family secretion protein
MKTKEGKRTKKGKWIAIIVVCLVVAGIAAAVMFSRQDSDVLTDDWDSVSYEGTENNYYIGIVEAEDTWNITKDASKEISEVMVSEGDSVVTGQVLFTYDTADTASKLESARIELDSLQNDVTDYTNQMNQLQQQLNGASEDMRLELNAQISDLNVSIRQAQLSVKTKQVEINKLTADLDNSVVTSKMDGVVQTVNGTDYYMVILATGAYHIKGTVDELNVYALSEGQQVTVHSRVNDDTWSGTITRIENSTANANSGDNYSSSSSDDNSASKYNFYVELESSDGLRMGQHVYLETIEDAGVDEDTAGDEGIGVNENAAEEGVTLPEEEEP